MVALDRALDAFDIKGKEKALSGVLLGNIVLVVLALTVLLAYKSKYPLNYALLGLVTVLAGVVWGIGGEFLPADLHFQVVGIICVAMVCMTALSTALSYTNWNAWDLVLASTFFGWSIGAAADLWIAPLL